MTLRAARNLLLRLALYLTEERPFGATNKMSGGYIVLLKDPPGNEATKEIWFAHLGDMDKAVQAVETSTGAVRSQITVLGTVRHAVLVDHLGVPEGEARRFDGVLAKEMVKSRR